MQRLLYYPNFEIEDMNFLKLALIYIDEIKPIIPMCARDSLSSNTKEIMNYTDLIQPIHPEWDDSKLASRAAIAFLEDCDKYQQYSYIDYTSQKRFITGKKDYILFSDKFTYEFENYCLEKELGERCDDGMIIDQDVAYSYMSILANVISTDREIDMITDSVKYADACFTKPYGRNNKQTYRRLSEIKRAIEFHLPVDMRRIPLDEFIKLRADERFNTARINFARELNRVLDNQDVDNYAIDLYDYMNCKNEIYGLLKEFFVSCAAAVVSVHSFGGALVNPESSLAFFSNIGNGVLSLDALKHSIVDGREYIEQLERKRQARRYLAKLNTLGFGRL